MRALPPIDTHAHVLTGIAELDLRALRSVIFAVTREPSEWNAAIGRSDEQCIWGLGCHPGVAAAFEDFDADRLFDAAAEMPLIGEVGLDGGSKVPMAVQRQVFASALRVAQQRSRMVSIHSVRASGAVLEELEQAGGIPGAILHWWRGSAAETRRAIELGCYFSLNGAEAASPKVIAALPSERVLTETDYPHTRRSDKHADRPGAVETIENALATEWGLDGAEVRRRLWKNLAELCAATQTSGLMPRRVQASLLTVR